MDPGRHSPTGPIDMLAGLTIEASGKPLAWRRDPYEAAADVPRGISSLDVDFQYLCGRTPPQDIQMTSEMLALE